MQKGLIEEIIAATNLPAESLRQEMMNFFIECGVDPLTNDIEKIRKVLAMYLQIAIVGAKKEAGPL